MRVGGRETEEEDEDESRNGPINLLIRKVTSKVSITSSPNTNYYY